MKSVWTLAAITAAALLVAGCVQPDAVGLGSPRADAHSGDQSGGAGTINVGAVSISGGAALALVLVGLAFLARYRQRGGALRLLAEESEDRPDSWKQCIRRKAVARGIERELHRAVKRVRVAKAAEGGMTS